MESSSNSRKRKEAPATEEADASSPPRRSTRNRGAVKEEAAAAEQVAETTKDKDNETPAANGAEASKDKEGEKSNDTTAAAAAAAAAAAEEESLEAKKPSAAAETPTVAPVKPTTPEEQAYWNKMFFKFMLYRAKNDGSVSVKGSDNDNKELHAWIVQLRKDYKLREQKAESPLTQDQIDVLESVRFAFTTRGEEHWQKNYDKLKEYKKEHGHVLVPRQCEIPGLGDWVTSQRQQYQDFVQGKNTPLTKQRKEMLDELGFQWRVRNRPEWSSKYQELLEYKSKHGDTRVPQHYSENKALGKWVAKQREQYKLLKKGKHSFLTPDRLEKLNSIGFVWSVRGETVDDDPTSSRPAAVKEEEKKTPETEKTTTAEAATAEEGKQEEGEKETAKEGAKNGDGVIPKAETEIEV
eukprot:CAMPEP_0178762858 /NCGR_PEP_ID=MMETSP0744-20121128/16788_1 /TAXON_ID=913974 /ORGANISM="Nitzschia punctata, Strain CCMP561" /LENGTH=408 /DNA_ID=CAMNT_0020417607 /DNA_START=142 /DNA_END=1368 /DNA_ORIENTATION=-